jgi:Ras-related GTP-binding protein C/D
MEEAYGSYTNSSFEEDLDKLDSSSSLEDVSRPRIILMSTRRSGKSSIQKVVFHKMSPHETLFLESTNEIRVRDINTSALVQFQLLDFPGNFDFNDKKSRVKPELIFNRTSSALVFVIDAQDDENQFSEAIDYFIQCAKVAYRVNPRISFDILIHKVDGDAYLSDEHKLECQNEIKKSIAEELNDSQLNIRPRYHLTSIYDHTIFEAFSKIVQSLIPQLALLEKLLDGLIGSCQMEKAFLFDVVSKIYVATDSNPVDMQTYELCSDMIDVVIDVSCIYGLNKANRNSNSAQNNANNTGVASNSTSNAGNQSNPAAAADSSLGLAYDSDSASVIKLSNNYILYLREVNKYLALVCLMRSESYDKSGLVEYNFACFRSAISKLFEVKSKFKQEQQLSDRAKNQIKQQTQQPNSQGQSQHKK